MTGLARRSLGFWDGGHYRNLPPCGACPSFALETVFRSDRRRDLDYLGWEKHRGWRCAGLCCPPRFLAGGLAPEVAYCPAFLARTDEERQDRDARR